VREINSPRSSASIVCFAGFLGTWLGKPYHGKGYNKLAKDSFFSELFYELDNPAFSCTSNKVIVPIGLPHSSKIVREINSPRSSANPIGTITLFDVQEKAGFLGTWLGKPYHGKGYNKLAKDSFFSELFYELDIETIFMRIRKINIFFLHIK
jgi:RimJ/RimL family protein N-acetyltransferase